MSTDKETLADLAAKVYEDLHSAASENFVSSLLAASFNESEEFRRWLIRKAGLAKRWDAKDFHASANDTLFRGLRAKKKDDIPQYTFPDVWLWKRGNQSFWDRLSEMQTGSLTSQGTKRVPAIFIELKQGWVSKRDCRKYNAFLQGMKKEAFEFRFLLITSLDPNQIAFLKRLKGSYPLLGKQGQLEDLLRRHEDYVQILTLKEVFEEFRDNCTTYDKPGCLAIQFTKYFLELLVDPTLERHWNAMLEYYDYDRKKHSKALKIEITLAIQGLAIRQAFSETHTMRKYLEGVEYDSVNLQPNAKLKCNENGTTDKDILTVQIGECEKLKFNLMKDDAKKVSQKLKRARKYLESCRTKG